MAGEIFSRYKNTLEAEQILAQKLTRLSGKIVVKGSLALRDSPLEELPPDVDIFGNLDLSGFPSKN